MWWTDSRCWPGSAHGVAEGYSWVLSARAERDLNALPEGVAVAMLEFIAGPIAENPWRLGGPLRDRWQGYRSAHRAGYRVMYRVDEDAGRVRVARIAPRPDAYGP